MLLVVQFVAILAVLALGRRFAFGVFFVSAGVFVMAGSAVGGGLFIDSDDPVSLRFVTLDEAPLVAMEEAPTGIAGAHQASSPTILSHRSDLAELREHIKYELRRGNIGAEKAITLNRLIGEIEREATVNQAAAQQQALANLVQWQARLNETLADTVKLVEVLGSVNSPEFAGTFIAAKIQVVRLLAEKAAIDGSIDEIRQSMKRPKAG